MIPPDDSLEGRVNKNSDHPKENFFSPVKDWGKNVGIKVGTAAVNAYHFMTDTPARIILVAGTAFSLFAGFGVSKIMDYKSTHRPIHFTPYSAQGESEDVMLDISRGISDLNNKLGLLYVQASGVSSEDAPDETTLKRIVDEEIERAKGIINLINRGQEYMGKFVPHINALRNGGRRLDSSFSHRKRDEYHTECHTEMDEVCSGSGDDRVCTPVTRVVCDEVYDYTDHYWTFSDAQAHAALREEFLPALESLKMHPLKVIAYNQLRRTEVPEKDAIGREIKDREEYLKQANEWLDQGVAAKQTALARMDFVTGDGYLREMLADAQSPQGFTGLSTYPSSTHVRNYCSSCDEDGAPRGYLTLKRVERVTEGYTKPYGEIAVVFSAAPAHLQNVITELGLVREKLDDGEKVTADDILRAADRSTQAYLTMVPDSVSTAPTSGERFWWPVGVTMGLLLLTGIGAGVAASQDDYTPRYRGEFRRW